MQGKYAILTLAVIGFVATAQAGLKEYPPEFPENPNARYNGDLRVDDNDPSNYRLPNNTVPVEYNVKLTTDVHTGTLPFDGIVEIKLNSLVDTKTIVLHQRRLTINKATIRPATSAVEWDMSFTYEAQREFLSLTPVDTSVTLTEGSQWFLTIHYNGSLRLDNAGFYLSTYLDSNQATRYLATTQFESTDARHAFPCYDEPAKRATFTITIDHHESYAAISNMPIKSTTNNNNRNITVFETTPSMPSYLVGFIISDFVHIEGHLNSIEHSIYSRPGTENSQDFALISGILILESLANYFEVKFALPAMKQIAVPDFAAGAMENWGLVTYRETALLYDKKESSTSTQSNIANIIAHEFTHQWFGNHVTIDWWGFLWLKEGFATMFSYKGSDDSYPDWDVMQFFHTDDYQSALSNDAGASQRPMTYYVQLPNQISALYDSISYAKAGSVLFMFQYALTDAVFQRGLHNYLTNNQYGTGTDLKLFTAMETAAKELSYSLPDTITNMFGSWSNQGGYPLLTVTRHYNGSFTVHQKPYFNDKTIVSTKSWYVPFNYAKQSHPDFRNTEATHYLLNVPSIHVTDNQLSNDEWLILNKQSTGYYRIMYDEQNWHHIINGLIEKPHKIHPRNRAQLLHDMYSFVNGVLLPHEHLMSMLTYLPKEDQYAPWSTANSILTTFNRYLSGDAEYMHFQFFVSMVAGDLYDRLGVNDVPGEHRNNKYMRSIAINLNCMAGNTDCLSETNNKLKGLINDNISIEPNLRTQTYCNGLRQSGNAEFNHMINLMMETDDQAERRVIISGCGCSQDATQLRRFMDYSVSTTADNKLRTQERTTLLSSAYSRGEVGVLTSIEFLNDNWDVYSELENGGFSNSNPLDDAIRGIANYVTNKDQETKLLALIAKLKAANAPNLTSNLETVVNSRIQANYDWLAINRDPVMKWIAEYRTGSGASMSATIATIVIAISMVVSRLL